MFPFGFSILDGEYIYRAWLEMTVFDKGSTSTVIQIKDLTRSILTSSSKCQNSDTIYTNYAQDHWNAFDADSTSLLDTFRGLYVDKGRQIYSFDDPQNLRATTCNMLILGLQELGDDSDEVYFNGTAKGDIILTVDYDDFYELAGNYNQNRAYDITPYKNYWLSEKKVLQLLEMMIGIKLTLHRRAH